MDKLLFVH